MKALPLKTTPYLRDLCTLGIGGIADHYLAISDISLLKKVLKESYEKNKRVFILGKGSNCFFDDLGFPGLVIHNKISFFEEKAPGLFHVGAGFSFSLLGLKTAKQGFSGLEFAAGIPGSLGGAVYMNAGSCGQETADCLQSVDYIDEKGRFFVIPKKELVFDYRTSSFQTLKGAITGATFQLHPSDTVRKKQIDFLDHKTKTQPYSAKSAGCTFRNPPQGLKAAQLIEQAGLKGFQIGGAKVSNLHANFLINENKASSQDFLSLISHVQNIVKKRSGVELKQEVYYIS